MILAGTEIHRRVKEGVVTIDPFEPAHLNPASIDLTLGSTVAVYEDFTSCQAADEWEAAKDKTRPYTNYHPDFGKGAYDGRGLMSGGQSQALNTKEPARLRKWEIDPEIGWVILPGVGYLMHTVERIHTDVYVPVLDGKSSIGRLFVQVHVTAGFGDPGFNGQYTLEVTSKFPVRLFPGMRVCQMRFHHLDGDAVSYQKLGHYIGDKAVGPVASEVSSTSFKR